MHTLIKEGCPLRAGMWSDSVLYSLIWWLLGVCVQSCHQTLIVVPGLDKIEFLQSHDNQEIYQKAFDLIEHYFGVEEEDNSLAPQVDQANQQYLFPQQEAPMEGFQL